MEYDVELLRDLLFEIETTLALHPSGTTLSVDERAIDIGRTPREVESGLVHLLEVGYIDGPGGDRPGFFSIAGLSPKGVAFVETARRPHDWAAMKRHFGLHHEPDEPRGSA